MAFFIAITFAGAKPAQHSHKSERRHEPIAPPSPLSLPPITGDMVHYRHKATSKQRKQTYQVHNKMRQRRCKQKTQQREAAPTERPLLPAHGRCIILGVNIKPKHRRQESKLASQHLGHRNSAFQISLRIALCPDFKGQPGSCLQGWWCPLCL